MEKLNSDITDKVVMRSMDADDLLRSVNTKGDPEITAEERTCSFFIAAHNHCHKQVMKMNRPYCCL